MSEEKIQSYVKNRYNCCTKLASDPTYVAENILNWEFKSDKPNEKWFTDVSEFKYGIDKDEKKDKIYLSVILYLCGNRLVAFECSDHNDNPLVFIPFIKDFQLIQGQSRSFILSGDTSIPLKHSGRK